MTYIEATVNDGYIDTDLMGPYTLSILHADKQWDGEQGQGLPRGRRLMDDLPGERAEALFSDVECASID